MREEEGREEEAERKKKEGERNGGRERRKEGGRKGERKGGYGVINSWLPTWGTTVSEEEVVST